jgi:hypothetical protein
MIRVGKMMNFIAVVCRKRVTEKSSSLKRTKKKNDKMGGKLSVGVFFRVYVEFVKG